MRIPTASDLLRAWELGEQQTQTVRGWLLLAPAFPEQSRDTLFRLSQGVRHRLLLKLRLALLGDQLRLVTVCPACAGNVEFELEASAILEGADPSPNPEQSFALEEDGFSLTLRLLNAYDQEAAEQLGEAQTLYSIGRRSIVSATCNGVLHRPDELPPELLIRSAALLAEWDPLSQIDVSLECPECVHGWNAPFDPVAFLWAEVATLAKRLLLEVHTLAARYGWDEEAILRMNPARRSAYLEMGA